MAKILVAGLNPAWQQIFALPALRMGAVNRAGEYQALASGKGMNAARILAARGHDVSLLQVLAGENGRRMLADCAQKGIRSLHVFTEGETRVAATLLHAGETTEIIGPFSVSGAPPDLLADQLLAQVPGERFDALLVCGTLPSGFSGEMYGALADRVNAPLLIWDSVAGLSAGALSRVTWLKVNAEEHRALAPLLAQSSARLSLLITDGANPASVRFPPGADGAAPQALSCAVPRVENILNPIGAGDTVTAMLADGLLGGMDARAAVSRALAAAAASCLHLLPATWLPEDAARIEKDILWARA